MGTGCGLCIRLGEGTLLECCVMVTLRSVICTTPTSGSAAGCLHGSCCNHHDRQGDRLCPVKYSLMSLPTINNINATSSHLWQQIEAHNARIIACCTGHHVR